MKFGLDRIRDEEGLQERLSGRKVALLGHPASVDEHLTHALDLLDNLPAIELSTAFGPQHGLRGDKQDNMMESPDFIDSTLQIPVHSLYGDVRRPTKQMMSDFDVLLVDLQDLGCRIYTFITTLLYALEACADFGKEVWVLDRPNPIGRPVEGLVLQEGWESFVGAGPIPMRHGMTMGELALWFKAKMGLVLDLNVIEMRGWDPTEPPGYGWPMDRRAWVNPSPNAPSIAMARCYPGTVMIEGTTLSEGRGTTRPLEMVGAPNLPVHDISRSMNRLNSSWLLGCQLRSCWFEPTFHKHEGELCAGIQVHVEPDCFFDNTQFHPWRLIALFLKGVRSVDPDFELWRDFHYEYETDRLAIDLINGGPLLRQWVDDPNATPSELEAIAHRDEVKWLEEREEYLLYR